MHQSIADLLVQHNVPHKRLLHSDHNVRTLRDFVKVPGYRAPQIAKTLFLQAGRNRSRFDTYCLAVGPVFKLMYLRKIAVRCKVPHLKLAYEADIGKLLDHPVSGVSPLACPSRFRVFMDISLLEHPVIVIGSGAEGEELEISPAAIAALTGATVMPLILMR